ncbi:TPA: XoxI protein [Bacillus thuringiensis]|nr:XoxI protein [Bacillus thuringiensis]
MKKVLASSTVIFGLSVSMLGTVQADATDGTLYKTETSIHDYTEATEKITYKELIGVNSATLAAPTNTSKTTAKLWAAGKPYGVSTSSSSIKEDSIYAQNRLIKGSGVTIGSNSNTAKKSSYASASVTHPNLLPGIGDYAVGNHTYKTSGYKTVYHETKDKF